MRAVELFPADVYNQKTIRQGHPIGQIVTVVSTISWLSAAGQPV
jgi:hypothetical protein